MRNGKRTTAREYRSAVRRQKTPHCRSPYWHTSAGLDTLSGLTQGSSAVEGSGTSARPYLTVVRLVRAACLYRPRLPNRRATACCSS